MSKITLNKFANLIINNTHVNEIIKFIVKYYRNIRSRYNFRNWKYIIFKINFASDSIEIEILFDTKCDIILIDWIYLYKYLLNLEIKTITTSLLIKDINNKIVNINEYIIITIYVRDTLNGQWRIVYLIMNIYIVNDLKTYIFIGINILIPEGIVIDLDIKTFTLNKYLKLQALFDIIVKLNSYSKRTIRFKSVIIIVLNITIEILVAYNNNILYNRDFLFESNYV